MATKKSIKGDSIPIEKKGDIIIDLKTGKEVEKLATSVPDADVPVVDDIIARAGTKKKKEQLINMDFSDEDILRLDKAGFELGFESGLDGFKPMADKFIMELTKENRDKYLLSQAYYKMAQKAAANPKIPGIDVWQPNAMATDRLEVSGKDPNFAYCWKRPDQLQTHRGDGWEPVRDDGIRAFYKENGVPKVTLRGHTELVLCQMPKEKRDAIERVHQQKSRDRMSAVKSDAETEIKSQGGITFDPNNPRPGTVFGPPEGD
ncbi:MAG: hypothetical protein ABID54_14265 [Pseudomonadota bacterium]